MSDSLFKQRVIEIIRAIPHGTVMSYGQIAACAGIARAARQVGWILNKSEGSNLPWWRVMNNTGRITIKGSQYTAQLQADLLRAEGITFTEPLIVHIAVHRYIPHCAQLQAWSLPDYYIQHLLAEYNLD